MLSKDFLDFITELKVNNNREWFDKNRDRYQIAKKEFEGYLNYLIPLIASFDPGIQPVTAKECMFRIFRDVRFSKDKTPYKPNFGGYIARGGRKSPFAGYYLHVENGDSFLAGGIYMPQSAVLKEVREEILEETDKFKKIISDKNFKKYFEEIWGEKLKSAPRGFPKDFPDIELLKYKGYNMVHKIDAKKVAKKGFTNYAISIFKEMYPLNSFINRVIENM